MHYPSENTPWRLAWSADLSVGIAEIDAEHRHFIDLVNALNRAIAGRLALAEVQKRMQAVMDDAAIHFAHEEALFKQWGYPDTEEHARKHTLILKALHAIMTRFDSGSTEYEWIEAGLKVKNVLIEHLLAEDMKYRDYYIATGRANV